jgi:hypothetical protein
MSPAWIVPLLALAGSGLGVFMPAHNAVIMRTAPRETGPSGAFG